eukprot:3815118-Prorocentrum_lima.AAC.1
MAIVMVMVGFAAYSVGYEPGAEAKWDGEAPGAGSGSTDVFASAMERHSRSPAPLRRNHSGRT